MINHSIIQDTSSDIESFNDYRTLVHSFNEKFTENVYYLEVGTIPNLQGWVIYIPVSFKNFDIFFKRLNTILSTDKIPFKLPVNKDAHISLQQGFFGTEHLGKIICIYPPIHSDLYKLALNLIRITSDWKGASLPSAIHLGNLVYTRFEDYIPVYSMEGEMVSRDNGEFIKSSYDIPYQIPKWANWPFAEIPKPSSLKPQMLLNKKYNILKTVAHAPKGRLMYGLFRVKNLKFEQCFIKEGKRALFEDEEGRDMIDRIQWQMEFHNAHQNILPIPKVYDYFIESGNAYLVLEPIDGKNFGQWLDEIYNNNSWTGLNLQQKELILNKILEIIKVLEKIHALGYIHRDINDVNFMIDKNGNVVIIDFELTYAIDKSDIIPHYKGGTDSYWSPEQLRNDIPTYQQDIFSLGVLIIHAITRISPQRFMKKDINSISRMLNFFLGDTIFTSILLKCISVDAIDRPTLEIIYFETEKYLAQSKIEDYKPKANIEPKEIKFITQASINGLGFKGMINEDGYWSSQISVNQSDRTIYLGLYKGISGVLYTISLAKKMGLDISSLQPLIDKNSSLLLSYLSNTDTHIVPGLYHNCSGIGIAIHALLEASLIPYTDGNLNCLKICFESYPLEIDFESGLSGHCIALLTCRFLLDEPIVQEKMSFYTNYIVSKQNKKGSWSTNLNENSKRKEILSFEKGTSGIAFTLLNIYQIYKSDKLKSHIIKALNYLISKSTTVGKDITWVSMKTEISSLLFVGDAGIALTFIKAYEVLGDHKYKEIAEKVLTRIPEFITINDTSLNQGLPGLAEVYMEAYKKFKDRKWYNRAQWIINILVLTADKNVHGLHWIQHDPLQPYADLIYGNSGIIHCMMKSFRVLN